MASTSSSEPSSLPPSSSVGSQDTLSAAPSQLQTTNNPADNLLWNPTLQVQAADTAQSGGSINPFAQLDLTSNTSNWSFSGQTPNTNAQLNNTLSTFNGLLTAVQPVSTSNTFPDNSFDFDLFASLNAQNGNLAWGEFDSHLR